jgi:hypothetical protein
VQNYIFSILKISKYMFYKSVIFFKVYKMGFIIYLKGLKIKEELSIENAKL